MRTGLPTMTYVQTRYPSEACYCVLHACIDARIANNCEMNTLDRAASFFFLCYDGFISLARFVPKCISFRERQFWERQFEKQMRRLFLRSFSLFCLSLKASCLTELLTLLYGGTHLLNANHTYTLRRELPILYLLGSVSQSSCNRK